MKERSKAFIVIGPSHCVQVCPDSFVITTGNESPPAVSIFTPLNNIGEGQSDDGGECPYNGGDDYAMLRFQIPKEYVIRHAEIEFKLAYRWGRTPCFAQRNDGL